jgi:hypothetical protein
MEMGVTLTTLRRLNFRKTGVNKKKNIQVLGNPDLKQAPEKW